MNNKKNIAFRNKTIPEYIDDKGNVNGDLTVQWNASGIYTVA